MKGHLVDALRQLPVSGRLREPRTARRLHRVLSLCAAFGSASVGLGGRGQPPDVGGPLPLGLPTASAAACPAEMARVGAFCIDRWEIHTVDVATGEPLSPFYPPEPRLLTFAHDFWSAELTQVGPERARVLPLPRVPDHQRGTFAPRAVSSPGTLPQGYMTYYSAKRACENAGKRLCTEEEWVRACRGRRGTKHPYGANFEPGRCNVFRQLHPAYELHGNSSLGHLDPRLHLVLEEGTRPLLLLTGQAAHCASLASDGEVYDMVGNLDEWIDDPEGTFLGGFYSRSTREGCDAKIEGHAPQYTDYSLGTRCCR